MHWKLSKWEKVGFMLGLGIWKVIIEPPVKAVKAIKKLVTKGGENDEKRI